MCCRGSCVSFCKKIEEKPSDVSRTNTAKYVKNTNTLNGDKTTTTTGDSEDNGGLNDDDIIIGIVSVIFLTLIIFVCIFLYKKNRKPA